VTRLSMTICCGKGSSIVGMRKIVSSLLLFATCSALALSQETITGTVRNQTLGQFAVGDDVILIRLVGNMRQEDRSRTDAQGAFTLRVRQSGERYLVRVVHQGVDYDRRASAGDALSVDVFDAAAKVDGLNGSVEILRMGTRGEYLHVSDMIEIRNDSWPRLTRAGKHTFEIYLPPHAKIASVLAAAPASGSEQAGMMISASCAHEEPQHCFVDFPLRPGATKFAFNYDVPYAGRARFHTRSVYPLQQLAVMVPPAMKFTSLSSGFHVLPAGNDRYQVVAASELTAGAGPSFEISGVGALPAVRPRSPVSPATRPANALTPQRSPAAQFQGPPSHLSAVPALSSQMRWWFLGSSCVLILGIFGMYLWHSPKHS
jgi:hypothetical protein